MQSQADINNKTFIIQATQYTYCKIFYELQINQNHHFKLKIHLSRFQYQNGLFEKIDDFINFPLKKLDLSEWVFKDNKQQEEQKNGNASDGTSQFTSSFNQNLSKYQKQNDQSDIYDLFAAVNHLGNGHGGHYTSYVNIKEDGSEVKDCWVNFDDESVNYINQENVISNKGYLLIYKKKFSTSAIVNLTYKKL